MSAKGLKQTFRSALATSALPPKADIRPKGLVYSFNERRIVVGRSRAIHPL
jgi:hypothetical protein